MIPKLPKLLKLLGLPKLAGSIVFGLRGHGILQPLGDSINALTTTQPGEHLVVHLGVGKSRQHRLVVVKAAFQLVDFLTEAVFGLLQRLLIVAMGYPMLCASPAWVVAVAL